ncbi:MAG: SUMF1/EgtB/PvdO family nonheme iron enzyme [Chloroflexi bacterium]|jgi:formylglycine-generating enzyme required for sulfatase activity|nr:SUMF1/EgtB/PvdO family nonheme iron enzyme [Chloroflexota bacterium]
MLSKYPITYAQFQAFIDAKDGFTDERWWQDLFMKNQAMFPQRYKYGNHPRDNVSWYQAVAFCRWLTFSYHKADLLLRNYEIRLPSEQQWEIAARMPDNRVYPWGMNYSTNAANLGQIGMTSTVGIYPQGQNNDGIEDMAGNVWEWCINDYYDASSTSTSSDRRKALRGGAWVNSTEKYLRSTSRNHCVPYATTDYIGFRVCAVKHYAS